MTRLKAYSDNILAINGDFGDKTTRSGIIVKSSIGKEEGVVPRWFQVFDVGPEIDWLEEGQWVYVEYGRWTEGFKVKDERLEQGQEIWKVDPAGCMLVADDKPDDQVNIKSASYDFEHKKTL